MGIKAFNPFLQKKCPQVFNKIHLSEYAYKKVAIDLTLYLCTFKAGSGDEWLRRFIELVACLRDNEIHCVFIFDGKAPEEKSIRKQERKEHKEKLEMKVVNLEFSYDHFLQTGQIDENIENLFKNKRNTKSLLKKHRGMTAENIRREIDNVSKQVIDISESDMLVVKELFDLLKIPYFVSPTEAETMCSELCRLGKVDAVLSLDTDVLAYGAPVFLSKIDTWRNTCMRIEHHEILEALDLTENQFIDLCIMCGTDYNDNIKGVGPAGAYDLIQKYGSIDEIESSKAKDTTILNYKRAREIFKITNYSFDDVEVLYCGIPDFNDLEEFIIKYDIGIKVDKLKTKFIKELNFED